MQALVPETPEAVCQIVAKLLAKTAKDRYQGAWGLWEDLERCLRDLREQGTIELFLPGERDVPARFELPQKLYGRGMELARLLAALGGGAWEAEPGEPAVMFLAGESGLGKTSLADEVKRHVLLRQGRFAAGKYDELSRGAPYSGLLEALRELVRRLLAEEGVEVAALRRKIVNDLGTNLGILLEVLPELEAVTGEAASPVTVGPAEAKRRFHRSIGQLLKTFADTGDNAGPLVIFLDDLQWADPSSFELLTSTLTSELGPCLVLVAYRRDHIEAGRSLERLRGDLAGRGLRCESLELGPVGPNDVRQLVADALRMPAEESMPLADIVFEKTAGNPFFVRTFLTALYDEGWLRFRPGTGWEWDLERIAERDVEENVARLLEKKIDHLDAAARHVVARAATLGHRFDIETLAMVCELSETETEDHLLAACRQGILLKLGFTAQTEEYQFLHDRLRESAYSTIPAADRPATHLAIGRILAERQVASGDEARDFKAVHQLNRAHRLIDDLAERESVARLNLAAGLRARAGAAFPAADEFFTAGLELLGDDIWTTSYELALKLLRRVVIDLVAVARRIEAVRGNARDLLDAVPAYELEAALAHARLGEAEGLRATFEVLGHLGVELSPEIGAEEAKALLFAAFKSSEPLLALAPEELARMEDPVCLAAMRLLLRLAFVAAWTNQRRHGGPRHGADPRTRPRPRVGGLLCHVGSDAGAAHERLRQRSAPGGARPRAVRAPRRRALPLPGVVGLSAVGRRLPAAFLGDARAVRRRPPCGSRER